MRDHSKIDLAKLPFLEHYPEPGEPPHRILLDQLPFRIGRSMNANYIIYSRQVSKEHTELFRRGREFRIRDLGSSNGTFVNGERIQDSPLVNGDIIHIAHKEFRFGYEPQGATTEYNHSVTEPAMSQLPQSIIRGSAHLREMLTQHCARVVFQPIVHLDSGKIMGYEALGRGTHAELSPNPADLFHLATQCNLACELSRMFRVVAVEEAQRLPRDTSIFFNLHPTEMANEFLFDSLRALKNAFQDGQRVVLEIHESAVTDLATMQRLREYLNEIGMGLAYDDFGAGQARLAELTGVPPDYIKFDMSLIKGIDQAEPRQELLLALNRVIADLGVQAIAEGIETASEAEASLYVGCRFGQGYHFGRPQPLADIIVAHERAAVSTSASS